MEELKQHEAFEIEVLEDLHKAGFLKPLVFGGGTMLRLCHELPRYSVDLDFWFFKQTVYPVYFESLRVFLSKKYRLTDSKNKHFTLLYELRGKTSPRKLKIEIRKELLNRGTEDRIAFSVHASTQVLVRVLTLEEMVRRKLAAVKSRDEIRDYFDLEFLLRRGARVPFLDRDRVYLKKRIEHFRKTDFTTILGSLLDRELRDYYSKNGFSFLLQKLGAR